MAADAVKAKGNAAFQAGNFQEAIKFYTEVWCLMCWPSCPKAVPAGN